jgi:hypothetical protein
MDVAMMRKAHETRTGWCDISVADYYKGEDLWPKPEGLAQYAV